MEYDDFTTDDTIDIDATIEALREAWKIMPNAPLSLLLDTVTPAPFCELTNKELIESLNEFILQNQ
jgi:hypothetical protein